MNCPFCNLDEIRTRTLEERKHSRIILSNPRLMLGHLLVIPKRHVEKPSQLNEEERLEIFSTIIDFQEKIISKIAKGCDIRQNYRPFIQDGRTKVSHLHFHLQPREFEDELYHKRQKFDTSFFKDLTEEEIKETFELLG